jgi:hypothetical protein
VCIFIKQIVAHQSYCRRQILLSLLISSISRPLFPVSPPFYPQHGALLALCVCFTIFGSLEFRECQGIYLFWIHALIKPKESKKTVYTTAILDVYASLSDSALFSVVVILSRFMRSSREPSTSKP